MADENNNPPADEAEERQAPNSKVVHDAILREGEEELERTTSALAWSGFAAGLSMGLSLIVEGVLHALLPDQPWRPLVSKIGYSVGFIVVILGRQQLFTENTLTPILPLMAHPTAKNFGNVLRLWIVVLLSNLIGAAAVGFALAKAPVLEPTVREAVYQLAHEAVSPSAAILFGRGIFAGWVIALIVWLLPYAEAGRFWMILLLTYTIGIAKFSHVIAGSVEAYALAASGRLSWSTALVHFTLVSLIGNVIGGVALVAAVNHAQVVAGASDSEDA